MKSAQTLVRKSRLWNEGSATSAFVSPKYTFPRSPRFMSHEDEKAVRSRSLGRRYPQIRSYIDQKAQQISKMIDSEERNAKRFRNKKVTLGFEMNSIDACLKRKNNHKNFLSTAVGSSSRASKPTVSFSRAELPSPIKQNNPEEYRIIRQKNSAKRNKITWKPTRSNELGFYTQRKPFTTGQIFD